MTQQATSFSLQIDKFGRVVIPKKVREALGVKEGGTLEASVSGGELTLKSESPRYRIEYTRDGWPLIILADGAAAKIGNDPVSETPDERMEKLMKW